MLSQLPAADTSTDDLMALKAVHKKLVWGKTSKKSKKKKKSAGNEEVPQSKGQKTET